MIGKFLYPLAMGIFTLMLGGCSCKGAACHELANKPIYADLQGLESYHRGTALSAPLYLKGAIDSAKYDALGVPAKTGPYPNIWIAVNANDGSGGVLAVPSDEHMNINCDFVDNLIFTEKEKVDEAVGKYLKQQCITKAEK